MQNRETLISVFTSIDSLPLEPRMSLFSNNSEKSNDPERLLSQPERWLVLLGSGDKSEFFFYTMDLNHNLRFVSDSVFSISNIHATDWLNKSVIPALTDHVWNQRLPRSSTEFNPNTVYRTRVEVWDSEAKRVKLETWWRLITLNNLPIGVVGMAKRFERQNVQEVSTGPVELSELKRRIETLTSREVEVVKLVVRGELNKSIAKQLSIAMRTVEARRSKAMEKLGVRRLSDLIRVWILAMESSDSSDETPGNG